jgi:hypothetical protein
MRTMLSSKSSDINFASLLIDVGNGNIQSEDSYIKLNYELGTQIHTLNQGGPTRGPRSFLFALLHRRLIKTVIIIL